MKIELSTNGRELIIRIPVRTICIEARKKTKHIDVTTLTRRERQVLKGLLAGKANKEIGYDLGIGERTTKFHACQIYRKTGLTRQQILGNFGSVQ